MDHLQVAQVLAVIQIEGLDVIAIEGKGSKGVIGDGLAAANGQFLQESATAPTYVLHHLTLDVRLEVEQIDTLPIGAVQGQHCPRLGHLSTTAK